MKTLSTGLLAASLATLSFVTGPLAAQENPPQEPDRPLTAALTGDAETEGGDADGTGEATFRLDQGEGEICYQLTVSAIGPATAAHIHRGAEGESGPPVVTLDAPSDGTADGCVAVDAELMREIGERPDEFYVNVHTAEFPNGAVRGQLTR